MQQNSRNGLFCDKEFGRVLKTPSELLKRTDGHYQLDADPPRLCVGDN